MQVTLLNLTLAVTHVSSNHRLSLETYDFWSLCCFVSVNTPCKHWDVVSVIPCTFISHIQAFYYTVLIVRWCYHTTQGRLLSCAPSYVELIVFEPQDMHIWTRNKVLFPKALSCAGLQVGYYGLRVLSCCGSSCTIFPTSSRAGKHGWNRGNQP